MDKTTRIRLKPEYEIYNLIFGKTEKYDNDILNLIIKYNKIKNITFQEIKYLILNK